jgi:hypothetical protein
VSRSAGFADRDTRTAVFVPLRHRALDIGTASVATDLDIGVVGPDRAEPKQRANAFVRDSDHIRAERIHRRREAVDAHKPGTSPS